MKKGKYEQMPPAAPRKKPLILVLCLVLLLIGVGTTVAVLSKISNPVINTFEVGSVGAKIVESLNGDKTAKTAIQVENTGDSPVYVRVRLVSYMTENGAVAPVASPALSFTLGTNWKQIGDYYYYTKPLAGEATTTNLLGSSVPMAEGQVIDVLADTVQATPADAVLEVWGVSADQFES